MEGPECATQHASAQCKRQASMGRLQGRVRPRQTTGAAANEYWESEQTAGHAWPAAKHARSPSRHPHTHTHTHLGATEQHRFTPLRSCREGGSEGGACRRRRFAVPVALGQPPGGDERLEQRGDASADGCRQRCADVAGLSAHSAVVVQDEAAIQVGPAGEGCLQICCWLLLG